MLEKRITVFVGAYGSGKTELALNTVQMIAPHYSQVAIADLDIVKPYFRTREFHLRLVQNNVRVIMPTGVMAQADLPALPPEVYGVLQNENIKLILDVGGDDAGATALAQYHSYFVAPHYEMLMVINTCRPFAQNPTEIAELMERIQIRSRLTVTGLVSNTNLGAETTAEVILKGHKITQEVARLTKLPIAFTAVDKRLLAEVSPFLEGEIIPLTRQVLPPWER
ncbi:MAG: hypothetical protein FWF06_04740 [Symbiobacteriaceae bacterium]|nr:hypothetical protein [Symbiobacteriaceae bacterium]